MDNDWNAVVKIGKGINRGAGGPRETTVKGKAGLNAALRSGSVLATEKKYSTAQSSGKGLDGQHLTKVDRADGPVKTKKLAPEVSAAIKKGIAAKAKDVGKYTQADLGLATNISQNLISGWIAGNAKAPNEKPDPKQFDSMEAELEIHLRGKLIGQPKPKAVKEFKRGKDVK